MRCCCVAVHHYLVGCGRHRWRSHKTTGSHANEHQISISSSKRCCSMQEL